jgi:hypothetical protein
MTLRNKITSGLVAAVLFTSGAAFAGDVPLNDPAKEAEIRAVMTKEGFDVRSVGTIDGKFEIYAIKDGQAWEVFLDQKLMVIEKNPAKG